MSLRKHLIRYSRHRSAFRVHSLLVISQIPNTNQQRSHRRQGWSKAHEEQRGTVYLTEPVRQRNTEQEGRYQTVNHREQWKVNTSSRQPAKIKRIQFITFFYLQRS